MILYENHDYSRTYKRGSTFRPRKIPESEFLVAPARPTIPLRSLRFLL